MARTYYYNEIFGWELFHRFAWYFLIGGKIPCTDIKTRCQVWIPAGIHIVCCMVTLKMKTQEEVGWPRERRLGHPTAHTYWSRQTGQRQIWLEVTDSLNFWSCSCLSALTNRHRRQHRGITWKLTVQQFLSRKIIYCRRIHITISSVTWVYTVQLFNV